MKLLFYIFGITTGICLVLLYNFFKRKEFIYQKIEVPSATWNGLTFKEGSIQMATPCLIVITGPPIDPSEIQFGDTCFIEGVDSTKGILFDGNNNNNDKVIITKGYWAHHSDSLMADWKRELDQRKKDLQNK